MVKGWKNSPEWRRYYEAKLLARAEVANRNKIAELQRMANIQTQAIRDHFDAANSRPRWRNAGVSII